MRSLRLGESSWLSINNGRRQTSPGGWEREAREGGEEGKEIDGEREAASNLGYFTTVASSWCVGCLEGNEKVVDVRATHVPNVFRTRWQHEGRTKEK